MSPELDGDAVSWRGGESSCAFLLRCWQESRGDSSERPAWRFSLTHINETRQQKGFTNLEALVIYLQKELGKME